MSVYVCLKIMVGLVIFITKTHFAIIVANVKCGEHISNLVCYLHICEVLL